jgi:hypothetical protein
MKRFLYAFMLAWLISFMAVGPSFGAVTVSNIEHGSFGNKKAIFCDVTMDNSYAFGGETLAAATIGMSKIEKAIIESTNGYTFEYDYTNGTIMAYAKAPPVVFDEVVTVTSNVGTLKYPPAYIISVSVGNASYKVIPSGLTPVTGSCALSTPTWNTRSTLTFLAGDSVTTCNVTYVTQAWKEVFDNRVLATLTAGARVTGHADLTFTAGTPDTLDLGEYAAAVEFVMWNDNGTYKPCNALYLGEDPATTEVAIDFTNATSSETRASFREEDTVDAATDTVYVSYIAMPSSGFLSDHFIEEDDLTPSTDVVTTSSGRHNSNLLLFGTCGDLPGPTTAFAELISAKETVGTTATLVQPTSWGGEENTFTLGSDHSDANHVKLSYVYGDVGEIPVVPIQVPNGEDLSGITALKCVFIGD